MASCSFQPQQPLACDTSKNSVGLSRVALTDRNGFAKLGKVISCERKEDAPGCSKKEWWLDLAWLRSVDKRQEAISSADAHCIVVGALTFRRYPRPTHDAGPQRPA
mmetsp:Transcript_23902/g.32239  ORF Transcript_23902/g.32239 Transcript_23902/m.32239 type:complete len:106 (+) Transcript_23902:380-697(+)